MGLMRPTLSAFLMAGCCGAGVVPARPPTVSGGSRGLLARALSAIQRQEQAVRNVRVSASAISTGWRPRYDLTTKRWIFPRRPNVSSRAELSAIFDGLPWGKFRAEVPMEQIPSPGGLSSIYVESFTVAYNGRVGTYLQTATGTPKKLLGGDEGEISGRMPGAHLLAVGGTGWGASIYGYAAHRGHPRFSAYLSPNQPGITLRARWISARGRRYLRVARIGSPYGKGVFLLDPSAGFSIRECKWYWWRPVVGRGGRLVLRPNGRPRMALEKQPDNVFRVAGFFEPAPGVFYPKQVVAKDLYMGHLSVSTVTVSHVTVNDPNVGPETWVVQFPRGAVVRDLATNKVIRIAGTPQEQLKEIERAVKQAR